VPRAASDAKRPLDVSEVPTVRKVGRDTVAARNICHLGARYQRFLDDPRLVILRPALPPLEPAQDPDPHRLMWRGASVLMATFGLTLIEDLTIGIIAGCVLAAAFAVFDRMKRRSRLYS
jgi:hypothetical protein